jgi:parallel beta-helix repeat protein
MSRSDARPFQFRAALSTLALLAAIVPPTALAAESYDNCVGFIDTVPTTVTTQGVWCLRKDLSIGITGGVAVQIAANNITIDCNGFKLGGLPAGDATTTIGVHAGNRQNIRVRRCSVRGFAIGISLGGGKGNVAESNRLDGNKLFGIYVTGDGSAIRRNLVIDTGGGTYSPGTRRDAIVASGRVDIRDNTVSGVTPGTSVDTGVAGIAMSDGFASGNRISSLQSPFSATGISASGTVAAVVSGNFISGVGQWGIRCSTDAVVVRDNTVNGFTTGVNTCSDGGGNVHRP